MIQKLSAFVITKNEENKIERCLEHLKWIDEIVLMDSYSEDKTVSIAKKFTKKIYKKEFKGYAEQKQAAIDKCSNELVLEIDADEIVSDELKEEIKELLQNQYILNRYDAFIITREEFFLGKPLMTSKIIRLYKKNKIKYQGVIHEKIQVSGAIGKLKKHIIHDSDKYETIADRIEKINSYTAKEVEKKIKEERRMPLVKIILLMICEPIVYAMWLYVWKGVWRRGKRGIIWCLLTGYYHFLIYAKYYEYVYKENNVNS